MKFLGAKFLLGFVLTILILPGHISPAVHSQADPTVFVSEINIHGSIDDTNRCVAPNFQGTYETNITYCWKDEWIELFNPSTESVSLAGWVLEVRNGRVIPLTGILASGAYYTIGHIHNNGSFQSVISGFNLSSHQMMYLSSDSAHNVTYKLKNNLGSVVDSYTGAPTKIASNTTPGRSYHRCNSTAPWKISNAAIDSQNYGSPGYGNCTVIMPEPVPVEITPNPTPEPEIVTSPTTQTSPATPQQISQTVAEKDTVPVQAAQPQAAADKVLVPAVNQGKSQQTQVVDPTIFISQLAPLELNTSSVTLSQPKPLKSVVNAEIIPTYSVNTEAHKSLLSFIVLTAFLARVIHHISKYADKHVSILNQLHYVTRS
jgi:hypothetical protein